MTTEERVDAGEPNAGSVCERCGDFGTLRRVSARQLCAGCVERLPEFIRTPPSFGSLVRGVGWVLSRSAKRALPIALVYALLEVLMPWLLAIDQALFIVLVELALHPVAQLSLLGVFQSTLHGEPPAPREPGREVEQYTSLFFTNIYTTLVTVLAMLAFLVPGFIYMTRYLLAPAVVKFEGKGGGTAAKRSTAYVDGVGWPVFGALVLFFLAPVLINVVAAVVYEIYTLESTSSALGPVELLPVEIVSSLATMLGITALVSVVYANRRFNTATPGPAPAAPYPPSSARATPAP